MAKAYLPIGTVVLLQGGEKRLMICGVTQINPEDERQFDYIGCLYPEGYIDAENNYLFNAEDIDRVDFLGFVDSEQQAFQMKLTEFLQQGQPEN